MVPVMNVFSDILTLPARDLVKCHWHRPSPLCGRYFEHLVHFTIGSVLVPRKWANRVARPRYIHKDARQLRHRQRAVTGRSRGEVPTMQ
jgi:hypothetical protein